MDAEKVKQTMAAMVRLGAAPSPEEAVKGLIAMVERLNGRPLQTVEAPRRAGDPPSLIARAERVRQVLGWTPRHDSLEAIVGSQLEWERRLQREPHLQRNS